MVLRLKLSNADISLRDQLTDSMCKDSRIQVFCQGPPFGMTDLARENGATAEFVTIPLTTRLAEHLSRIEEI